MPEAETTLLLVDAGGTHARFAIGRPNGRPENIRVLPTPGYRRLEDAATAYLNQLGCPALDGAVVAIAGLVEGDRLGLTNGSWEFSREELRNHLGVGTLLILNDVEALALALPTLRPEDLVTIHPGKARPDGTRVVIALGTGLGAAALVATRQGFRALPTEAGHMSFALAGEEEFALGKLLETGDGRLSNEDVLSGRGILAIYQAMSQSRNQTAALQTAEAITAAAISASNPQAVDCIRLHARWVGRVASDLALAYNARGGVYLAGGVTRHLLPLLIDGSVGAAFEAKGRVSQMVRDIPIVAVSRGEPALMGCLEAWRGAS